MPACSFTTLLEWSGSKCVPGSKIPVDCFKKNAIKSKDFLLNSKFTRFCPSFGFWELQKDPCAEESSEWSQRAHKKRHECAGGTICDSKVYSLPSASGEERRLKPFSGGDVAPAEVPKEVLC